MRKRLHFENVRASGHFIEVFQHETSLLCFHKIQIIFASNSQSCSR